MTRTRRRRSEAPARTSLRAGALLRFCCVAAAACVLGLRQGASALPGLCAG